MDTGKHTLSLLYTIQQIDGTIPTFHKELLTSWLQHSDYHIRTYPPVTLPDILQGPIFHNPGFQFQWTDWVRAGIVRVADLCDVAILGFLPTIAIHELLTSNIECHRTLERTARELLGIQNNFPQQWIRLINTPNLRHTATLQPSFATEQHLPLTNCKTKHFYTHLLQTKKIPIPSLNHWQNHYHNHQSLTTTSEK